MKLNSSTLRTFTTLHTWVGVIAGFALFVAFYAGAISVFHHELQAWQSPHAADRPQQSLADAQRLLDETLQRHPAARKHVGMLFPGEESPHSVIYWQDEKGVWLFATLDENSRYAHGVLLPLLVHAAGIALVFAPGTMAIMHAVPEQDAGSASGLLQMDQQIGGALGIAIVAAIQAIGARPGQVIAGMPQAYLGAAAIAVLAAFVALGCAGRGAAVIRAGRAP